MPPAPPAWPVPPELLEGRCWFMADWALFAIEEKKPDMMVVWGRNGFVGLRLVQS